MIGAARRLPADVRAAVASWASARVLVLAGYVSAVAVAATWGTGAQPPQSAEGLLAWDGAFYRDIATDGYGALPAEALRFFPLFPLLGRAMGSVLRSDALALVLVANVCALALGVLVGRLVHTETGDGALARRAVWFTALFPASFVLAWAYAEALYLCLAVGTFLAMRRGRWWWAVPLGYAAALARPVGVVLAAAVAVEAWRAWRAGTWGARLASMLAVVAPVAGLASYLSWVARTSGDALEPLRSQGGLRGDTVNPVARLVQGIGDLVGAERFGDGLHVPFAFAFVALAVVVFRRWPASYGVYTVGVLALALGAQNLNSLERYGLNAFPLILALATLTSGERPRRIAYAVCGGGLASLCALAWLGVYVP